MLNTKMDYILGFFCSFALICVLVFFLVTFVGGFYTSIRYAPINQTFHKFCLESSGEYLGYSNECFYNNIFTQSKAELERNIFLKNNNLKLIK